MRATSSISGYENKSVDPRLVGQDLGVSAVLDASFQRSGDRFRATARLVETPSGRALWAGKVDVSFDDIFHVQDQVAQGIAEALTARLSAVDRGSTARRFTPSPDAYEEYLAAWRACVWAPKRAPCALSECSSTRSGSSRSTRSLGPARGDLPGDDRRRLRSQPGLVPEG